MTPEMVIVPAPKYRAPWRIICDRIARRHQTTYERAIAKGKRRNATLNARVEMVRALYAEGMSSTMVGRRINRDHTTVLWYLGHLNNPRRRKIP